MKVQPKHFNSKETQPYFRYWLLAIGAQLGDELPIHEYLIWNNEQVRNFKKLMGVHESKPLCHILDGSNRFGEYLKGLYGHIKCPTGKALC